MSRVSRLPRTDQIVIKGATLVGPGGERRADVRVVGDVIVEVETDIDVARGSRVIEGAGSYLLPAFVDLHTHLREPGGEQAETVLTGSRAAALGGYRCVLAMPNTTPTIDCVETVDYLRELAQEALCEIAISGAITVGRLGERLAPMAELARRGVHLFTDDGRGVQSDELMREALIIAASLGVVLAQHCENEEHARGGHMHEGSWSSRLGLSGQPSSAEEVMVSRDLALVRELDTTMHFLHLSTRGAIDLVRKAKAEGLRVTAEATPHHLALTHAEVVSYDPVYKVNPPLRTDLDVNAVREAIIDRTVDAIATDHAPHSPETKDETFDCAPPGMIGLETAFAVAYSELVAKQHLRVADNPLRAKASMADLVRLFSTNPARIAGLAPRTHGDEIVAGARADLVLFDPTERWRIGANDGASRSRNTPFVGLDLIGRVRHTLFCGEPVVVDAVAQR
jgi:dihydroorotase